ncbi:MAG: STAS domain-containing protein [Synergistaceae bacterium]|nr:STAS domain-containing protein [Synergistaceae bacterium]
MNLTTTTENGRLTISFEGRLDTSTAPKLERELAQLLKTETDVTFDFEGLEYLSSAGLRIVLMSHKRLRAVGGLLTVANVNDVIKNLFDLTGFSEILNIV